MATWVNDKSLFFSQPGLGKKIREVEIDWLVGCSLGWEVWVIFLCGFLFWLNIGFCSLTC